MTTVGSNIKRRREELGMTQEELARKLNYKSKSTINKIEAGINDITQSKVVAFATALDTTVAYIMGWEETDCRKPDLLYRLPDGSCVIFEAMKPHREQQIKRLLTYYCVLNEIGQKKALENIEDLSKIYSKSYTEQEEVCTVAPFTNVMDARNFLKSRKVAAWKKGELKDEDIINMANAIVQSIED